MIVTDRDELDKQIESVFRDVGQTMRRSASGHDLMSQLVSPSPRLLCTLVHKFGRRDVDDFDALIHELETNPPKTFGDLIVFVDECHRTQGGKLRRLMKAMMPGATFIGFTGTPLLKEDKQTRQDVFGGANIHTYKFGEAVADQVVLDLIYEARDVEQSPASAQQIDEWFEAKTKGLNDCQKSALMER